MSFKSSMVSYISTHEAVRLSNLDDNAAIVGEADQYFERDDDCHTSDDDFDSIITTELKPEYQLTLPDLVRFVISIIWTWIASAHYVKPTDHDLAFHGNKDAPKSNFENGNFEKRDNVHQQNPRMSRVDGYYHWACPFYRFDPVKYWHCLEKHRMRCFGDVFQHIERYHSQPPYCPTCFQTFNSTVKRDTHSRARSCTPCPPRVVDGLSKAQIDIIEKYGNLDFDKSGRWLCVWHVIFHNKKLEWSPFLEHGAEKQICMATDFWAVHGIPIVGSYLRSHNILSQERDFTQEKAISNLSRLVLKEVLGKIMEEKEFFEGNDESYELSNDWV